MATSKIKAIKSTLRKAIDYIVNPEKINDGGKYEFVVSTHIDQDHIHNHIIFNAVDYMNHRKYHSDQKDKYRIQDINADIRKAKNLSVLPKYVPRRKGKYENKRKKENESWKEKINQQLIRRL